MQYVIERATGRIVEICAEGSDTSRFDGENYLVVTAAEVHDPETERYDTQAGQWTLIPEAELLEAARKDAYRRLSEDWRQYMVSRGYPIDWRDTAREAREVARDVLSSADSTADQKAAAQRILDRLDALSRWAMGSVPQYFLQVNREIGAATSLDELRAISWDFSQLNVSDPRVDMPGEIVPYTLQARPPEPTE